MDLKTFLIKKVMLGFFVTVTCICVGMAILGMYFEPDKRFGYEGFLFPLFFGFASILPALISYSKREMSVREVMVRRLIQLILCEIIILLIVYLNGGLPNIAVAVSLALTIFIICIAVQLVLWLNDRKTAKTFNEALRKMQQSIRE